MEAHGGPAQPSPTIAQCLNGGFALKVRILKVRIMRTLSLVILLTYLISANALAEPMRCLAEQKYLYEEKGKWEKQYGGALLSVEVNQIFGSAKSSTITCKRASGKHQSGSRIKPVGYSGQRKERGFMERQKRRIDQLHVS
jgi:hypothetical protein